MGKNLEINTALEKYIEELSYNLHPIQQEIIKYNDGLRNDLDEVLFNYLK